MNAPFRRGACPAQSAPMPTGDGLLIRLSPAGTMALDTCAGLCAAVRDHGNGIVEVTARGSIQVRGLTAASAPAFARAVAMLGIDGRSHVPVVADPLAGLAPDAALDADALAAALRDALAATPRVAGLNPKVSVAIDAGATLHLDAMAADVRLRAELGRDGPRLHIALGGDAATAVPIGWVAPEHAVETVTRLLATIAARGRDARARDIVRGEGMSALRAVAAEFLTDAPPPPTRTGAEPIDTHRLHGGLVAYGVGLAFGHTDADALGQLIDAAKILEARGIRAAPGRALLILGVAPGMTPALSAAADRLGFIVRPADPRRHIVACPGMPLCASAQAPTRTLAPAVATAVASLFDGSLTVHLSGCAKGCAHARAAALTMVGEPGGCGVVVNGAACDRTLGRVPSDALLSRLARLASEVEHARRPDERAADTLSRLGAARIIAILQEAGRG
jgi:precorrin-3B synthase